MKKESVEFKIMLYITHLIHNNNTKQKYEEKQKCVIQRSGKLLLLKINWITLKYKYKLKIKYQYKIELHNIN